MILAETAPNTIVGNVIVVSGAFLILVFLLRKFAWKQIMGIFEARAKKITDDISAAEKAHTTAEELVQTREKELAGTREEAAGIVQNATTLATQTQQNMLKEAQDEVSNLKTRATEDIENERETAMKAVKSDVADLSVQIAEKLIGKSLDKAAQSDIIDSYLAELEK